MVELEYSGGGIGNASSEFRNDFLTRDDERAIDTNRCRRSPHPRRCWRCTTGSALAKALPKTFWCLAFRRSIAGCAT